MTRYGSAAIAALSMSATAVLAQLPATAPNSKAVAHARAAARPVAEHVDMSRACSAAAAARSLKDAARSAFMSKCQRI